MNCGLRYIDAFKSVCGRVISCINMRTVMAMMCLIIAVSGYAQSTSTTLTISPNPSCLNSNVTFTANVNPVAATGSVGFFYLDGTSLGTATLSGGVATFTTSTLPTGNNTFYAVYLGNGTYLTSTSANIAHTVGAALVAGSHNTNAVTACIGYNPPLLTIDNPVTSGGQSPYNFQWQINGVNTGSNSSSFQPPALLTAGSYTYHAIITDGCGNSVTTTDKTITIVADPTVSITGSNSVCLNAPLVLTAVPSGGE